MHNREKDLKNFSHIMREGNAAAAAASVVHTHDCVRHGASIAFSLCLSHSRSYIRERGRCGAADAKPPALECATYPHLYAKADVAVFVRAAIVYRAV